MISCVLLSAGESSRFGSPKALAKLNHGNVIENIQEKLLQVGVDEIVIVLGAWSQEIKTSLLKHTQIKVVYNKDYNLGQSSSFKVGLQQISPAAEGILLWPVDYPFILQATIQTLVDSFKKDVPLILIPTYQNKKGHPPIFHKRLKNEFLNLDHTKGINTIGQKYEDQVKLFPVNDSAVIKSFNTQEEFNELKQQFSQ